jgi:hypothetical protein
MFHYFLSWVVGASLIVSLLVPQTEAQDEHAPQFATAQSSGNPFELFQNFSATLNGGLGRDQDRRIFRSGKLMRLDFADHYRITDMEEPATWGMFPDRCAKFPMPDAGTWPFFGLREYETEQLSIPGPPETDTVDGHVCKVVQFTFVRSKSVPSTIKMKLWEAEDLKGFPVKIEVNNVERGRQYSITYTDVSLEPPDAKLFEHSTKCDSVSKPQPKKARRSLENPPKRLRSLPPHPGRIPARSPSLRKSRTQSAGATATRNDNGRVVLGGGPLSKLVSRRGRG